MLENPASAVDVPPVVKRTSQRTAWIVAAVALAAALALGVMHTTETQSVQLPVRFQVPSPEESSIFSFRLSPDARYLAFVALQGGRSQIWVRPLDSLEARPFPGTEGAGVSGNQLFWSPDSTFIGFVAQGKLKKVSVAGGPPQTLCDVPSIARATWGRAGVILVAPGPNTPIHQVPSTGGDLAPLTKPRPGENHFTPEFLPDGRHFLYSVMSGSSESNGLYIESLDGMSPVRLLPEAALPAVYVPTTIAGQSGHILFRRENTLMAQPFDLEKLRTTGEIFPLAEPVVQFSASDSGTLAYVSGVSTSRQELVWMDRTAKELEPAGPPAEYNSFRLSPDEKRIVFSRTEDVSPDIWVLDMTRGVPTRITFDPAVDNIPIWSPDGLQIVWPSNRSGPFDLYIKSATGSGRDELLIKLGTANGWATDWSRDGKFILYQKPGPKGARDLWIAPQSGAADAQKPFPYLESPFDKQNAVFSPNGHWVAYVSNESGRDEVYVQAFPLTSEKEHISAGGGADPAWSKDGAEIFYVAADFKLMAVPVHAAGPTLQPGKPEALFPMPGNFLTLRGSAGSGSGRRAYAPSSDGRRFLIAKPIEGTSGTPVTVQLNWQAVLKR